jgi:hypothetical protein
VPARILAGKIDQKEERPMPQVNLLFCLAATLLAQQGPINLNFQENGAGGTPKSWSTDSGYSTATFDDCRRPKSRCAVLRYEGRSDPQDFGGVSQTFDATALRGKLIRYKAWLRVKDPRRTALIIIGGLPRRSTHLDPTDRTEPSLMMPGITVSFVFNE